MHACNFHSKSSLLTSLLPCIFFQSQAVSGGKAQKSDLKMFGDPSLFANSVEHQTRGRAIGRSLADAAALLKAYVQAEEEAESVPVLRGLLSF